MAVSPPGVSARELMEIARIEERRSLLGSDVTVQRTLRSTRRVEGVVSEQAEHMETWHSVHGEIKQVHNWNGLAGKIADAIPAGDCAQMSPLSVGMMACLADRSATDVRVLHPLSASDGQFYQLAIKNLSSAAGHPFTSVWTLRVSDWRLVRVSFRLFALPEDIEYTVEEIHYRVREDLPVASEPAMRPRKLGRLAASDAASPAGHDAELDVVRKASLFLALHRLHLTPEDEVNMEFRDGHPIAIRVLAPDDARKKMFADALGNLEGVRAVVLSYLDADEPAVSERGVLTPSPEVAGAGQSLAPIRSEGPLLLEQLAKRWGGDERGREAALAFGASVIEATQQLRYRASWLTRLRNAFSAEERRLLPAVERYRLAAMDRDLVTELSFRHHLLHDEVMSALCPALCPAENEGSTHSAGDAIPPEIGSKTHLAAAMDQEFTALKVLFVDREFGAAPEVEPSVRAASPKEQIQDWRALSKQVTQLLHEAPDGFVRPLETSSR